MQHNLFSVVIPNHPTLMTLPLGKTRQYLDGPMKDSAVVLLREVVQSHLTLAVKELRLLHSKDSPAGEDGDSGNEGLCNSHDTSQD